MTNIFISYRRGDSIATAGRIRDRLVHEFGRDRVFVDIDDIAPGSDFADVIGQRIASSTVLLAVIGPGWIWAADDDDTRRLDDPGDFVAIELASALKTPGISVIPVLVDGAKMPTARELPEALKPLARRNAIELRNSQFAPDVERLIGAIRSAMPQHPMRRWLVLAAALLLVAASLAWVFAGVLRSPPEPAATAPLVVPTTTTTTAKATPPAPARAPAPSAATANAEVDTALQRLRGTLGSAEGHVQVAIRGGDRIRLGRQIVFDVTSKIPGRLILIDVNAAGEVVQIFPNRFLAGEAASLVPTDVATTIPGTGYGFSGFQATEPMGRGRLIAAVVPAAIPASRFQQVEIQRTKGFEPVNDPVVYLKQLVDELTAVATTPAGDDGRSIAFAVTDYEIIR